MGKSHFAFAAVLLVALALLFVGCVKPQQYVPIPAPTPGTNPTPAVQGESIKTFSSYSEIYDFLKPIGNSYGYGGYRGGMALDNMMVKSTAAPTVGAVAQEASSGTGQSASDYSATNVQVAGVDEPDIVKNDDRYIYVVKNEYRNANYYNPFASNNVGTMKIIDAFPAAGMKQVGSLELEGSISNMFVYKDKLVVFGSIYVPFYRPTTTVARSMCMDCVMPPYYSSNFAFMRVYDITDRASPKLLKRIEVKGSYNDARMIDGKVYSVFSDYAYSDYPVPLYRVDGADKQIAPSEISYFDWPDSSYNYNIFSGVDLNDLSKEESRKVVLMGSSQNLFVSQDNMYITYTTYDYYDPMWKVYNEVFSPYFDADTKAKMTEIDAKSMSAWRKERLKADAAMAFVSQKLLNPLDGSINSDLREELAKKLTERTASMNEQSRSEERTQVHKFALDGSFTYKGDASVPGRALNQFSMDESKGNFRIATTTGNTWDSQNPSTNNIYVLDSGMKQIGKIEGIAPGESIYSVRFMGDRAYMVTFKKIDPFFVIDLSVPTDPKILGKLKIPGYSDYLHPYDETHVIGLGKDAIDAESESRDFAWYQGVKLSLFDVSDVEHPKEVAKYEIGDRGTDSYALRDHKAFLFSKSKNLLVIPITLAKVDTLKYPNGVPPSTYGDFVFQGAYVFGITPEDGFKLKGTISHSSSDNFAKSGYYYYGNDNVQRSLYMDDYLYTVSDMYVKANSLDTLAPVSSVKIGTDQNSVAPVYAE